MSERLPGDDLRREHEALRKEMSGLEASVNALTTGETGAQDAVNRSLLARLQAFRELTLLHFRREEEVFFPFAQRMISEGGPQVAPLESFFKEEGEDDIGSHAFIRLRFQDMTDLLEGVQQARRLDDESSARLRTLVALTRSLLERHSNREERLIFPLMEDGLTPDEAAVVRKRLRLLAPGVRLRPLGTEET